MWFLRLAKSRHKLLRTQFLFGTKIKSTYKNVLRNTKILDLSVKRGSQRPIYVLGPRQKWVDLPPTFFELFINFLVVWHLLLNVQKNLSRPFFVLWKISKFSIFDHVQSQNGPYLAKTENGLDKFFWIFNSKCQTTRKLIKSSKNVGGKSTHFCLGPKTRIGRWDPRFTLRSKIFVFRSTVL